MIICGECHQQVRDGFKLCSCGAGSKRFDEFSEEINPHAVKICPVCRRVSEDKKRRKCVHCGSRLEVFSRESKLDNNIFVDDSNSRTSLCDGDLVHYDRINGRLRFWRNGRRLQLVINEKVESYFWLETGARDSVREVITVFAALSGLRVAVNPEALDVYILY